MSTLQDIIRIMDEIAKKEGIRLEICHNSYRSNGAYSADLDSISYESAHKFITDCNAPGRHMLVNFGTYGVCIYVFEGADEGDEWNELYKKYGSES